MEENKAGQYIADVIATTGEQMDLMKREGVFLEHWTPDARAYPDDVKNKGKNGFYYVGHYETYASLGFNTSAIPPAEAPKTMADLLNPKWKGKMSIVNTTTGTRWIGNTLENFGREYLEKIAEQDIKVQNMAGAALAGLVVSGEVPLSPTIFDANITQAKQKGAPVDWRPLEPVVTTVAYSGLLAKAPHPACGAALYRLDAFQRRPADDDERRPVVAARRHRIIGAEVQKILHRRKIWRRGSRKEIRRVGWADAEAIHATEIS